MGGNRLCSKGQIKITVLTPEVATIVSCQFIKFRTPPDRMFKLFNNCLLYTSPSPRDRS